MDIKVLLSFFTLLSAIIVVKGILTLITMRNKTTNSKPEVRLSVIFLWVGIIGTVFFGAITIITLINSESIWLSIGFAGFTLLELSMVVGYLNCVIQYNEDEFIVKNFFGCTKRYKYSQINGLTKGETTIIHMENNKKIRLDSAYANINPFISALKKGYSRSNGGKLCKSITIKYKLFNDNVDNPGEFVFVAALITCILLGLTVFIVVDIFNPKPLEELSKYKITLKDQYYDGTDLYFDSDQFDASFVIPNANDTVNRLNEFLNLQRGVALFIYLDYNEHELAKQRDDIFVDCLTDSTGTNYYETTIENSLRDGKDALFALLVLNVLNILGWSFQFYVMYNAEKYPRLTKLLVKPSYIRTFRRK